LGVVCWETDRLAEAADLFEQALQTQAALVDGFPDLPVHDQVLMEFFRLRLAAVFLRRDGPSDATEAPSRAREMLQTCVRNLTGLVSRPELADDRLASNTLQIAREALSTGEKTTGRLGMTLPTPRP
jgi:hypothetical protein